MGYIYVDTGAMYRAIGLYALRAGKDPKDNAAVNALLPQIELRLASIEGEQHIYLKEEDVSTAIRTEAAGMAASAVGANPAVRAFLLELQRDMAKKQDVLMDGRDIGTVVLPDAHEGNSGRLQNADHDAGRAVGAGAGRFQPDHFQADAEGIPHGCGDRSRSQVP